MKGDFLFMKSFCIKTNNQNIIDYLLNKIEIIDFNFYDVDIFNQCANERNLLISINYWENVHPLIKIIPIDWDYIIPFGILYSPNPSERVNRFIDAISQVYELKN